MEIISGEESAPPFVYYMAFVRNIQSNAGWYNNPFSAVSGSRISTMIHELGHNHGMYHTPGCGANDAERWPFDDSTVQAWGHSVIDTTLLAPDEHFDYMNYCNPRWVSPHSHFKSYRKIERMSELLRDECPDLGDCSWLEEPAPDRAERTERIVALEPAEAKAVRSADLAIGSVAMGSEPTGCSTDHVD
jgi:hypothetical protein